MLEALFSPRSVAVIGASRSEGKLGRSVLKNLVQYGYRGPVYPVNLKADEILGLRCYARVSDIPHDVDLAVIVVPSRFVPEVMADCAAKGVKAAIIISAGFREVGPEGAKLEREVVEIARKSGMRLLGPNSLGLIDTASSLNATFAASMPERGEIAFMSQSGALCTSILDWAGPAGVGFSKFVSLGNKADLDEVDMLEAWRDDERSRVILAYLEGIAEGRRFMDVARGLTKEKPLIVVKSGTTSAGSRAVSSHTGSLAGSEAAYNAAFKQCGVIRARSVEELFDYSVAFAYQPLPQGERVAIITNAGGPGIMAADACEKEGLALAALTAETIERLRSHLPTAASLYNPIDVLGDALADRYRLALEAALQDANVDAILVLLTPQAMTQIEETASSLVEASRRSAKPILACFMGGERVAPGVEILNRGHVPNYQYPERAVRALAAMCEHRQWREQEIELPVAFTVNRAQAEAAIEKARAAGRLRLGEMEACQVLSAYGLPLPKAALARSAEEAVASAEEIGYPVVMKVVSPEILHKSDIGGVRVGIQSASEVRDAFDLITYRATKYMPGADIWGILVQEMARQTREVIIGVTKDPQFGHLIMFGLGGIYVEALKDVTFRVAPLTPSEARAMITEIRSYPLLSGVRGERPADIDSIVDCLLRVSQLVTDLPEIVELDINPLMVGEVGQGALVVDCRMVIE